MMFAVFERFVSCLWGYPLLGVILLTGVYLTIRAGLFQFRYFGKIVLCPFKRSSMEGGKGKKEALSPFQAVCVAVGSTVGVSNISGVGSAIAVGGPGALFWLWVAAFLGMIIKMAEVSLAVYYRKTGPDGSLCGGPTYYMQRYFGEERGGKLWVVPAVMFALGLYTTHFFTLQNFTVAEAIGTTFNIPFIIPSLALVAGIYLVTLGGLKRIGMFASYMVPFMCLFYIGCAIVILIMNASAIPAALGAVFKGAFSGQSALGGFMGASVATAMRLGFARSVYSNEAGWGTSPMVHATAETDHPVKQGMMGAFEVFADTLCVCSATGLMVIVTGAWSSGITGAELTLVAIEGNLGSVARIIVALSIFMFALTSCGWYAYYTTLLKHAFSDKGPIMEKIGGIWLQLYRFCNPLWGFLLCMYTVYVGATPAQVWVVADFCTLIPTFVNVSVILIISGKFIKLVEDYKARYMGIGKIDPGFRPFFEEQASLREAKSVHGDTKPVAEYGPGYGL